MKTGKGYWTFVFLVNTLGFGTLAFLIAVANDLSGGACFAAVVGGAIFGSCYASIAERVDDPRM